MYLHTHTYLLCNAANIQLNMPDTGTVKRKLIMKCSLGNFIFHMGLRDIA